MAELNVITWLWGNKYGPQDVNRLAKAAKKYLLAKHRFHLFSEHSHYGLEPFIETHGIEDKHLIARNCFCRLRMFDPQWQKRHTIGGRIVSLDLDLIITGNLDPLFEDEAVFKILQDVNQVNPCRFNASVMMLRAGEHADMWNHFSLNAAMQIPYHQFPDDQGWIWHMLPKADGWKAGSASGIYGFQKPGWPHGRFDLPSDARIVAFIGKRKPQMYLRLPWVNKYWNECVQPIA